MVLAFAFVLSIYFAACVEAQIAAYGQCGGDGWCFNVDCQPGYVCEYASMYYSQCVPAPAPNGSLAQYGGFEYVEKDAIDMLIW
jgi:hypothetical protein